MPLPTQQHGRMRPTERRTVGKNMRARVYDKVHHEHCYLSLANVHKGIVQGTGQLLAKN